MPFDRDTMAGQLASLAERGVYLGTSSWKYEGWIDTLYTRSRYEYRGRLARSRFDRGSLAEYAEVFKTVCVDAAYYTFPRREYLEGLASQVPADFQFGFKVTDFITLKHFPNLERFGTHRGQPNPEFLNADLFTSAFLSPCEAIRNQVGVLMFEFSRFRATDYAHGRDFVADLDGFLGRLPRGWPYAIELRNPAWLHPEYLACLARHGVAHVFNSWEIMPPIGTQMALPGSRTNPELVAARLLLRPGRTYEQAVELFQPYDQLGELNDEVRGAAADLIRESLCQKRRKTYLYINNRLEGNSLETIDGIVRLLGNQAVPT